MNYACMLCTPTRTVPNKSHLGEGLRAFSTRGNCHPLSRWNNRLCPGRLNFIHGGWESSTGQGFPHIYVKILLHGISEILCLCFPLGLLWCHDLFTIAKCWKQPKCPSVNEWTRKLWYVYTMEYYAAERKKELLPLVTALTELENIMLSEIRQAAKDKYHMISPISGT